jgi:hypothetical protein
MLNPSNKKSNKKSSSSKPKSSNKQPPNVVRRPKKVAHASASFSDVLNVATDKIVDKVKNQHASDHIPMSVARFAEVYGNPFSEHSARLPYYPSISSQLTRPFASGTGVCNGIGNGWIIASPAQFLVSDQQSVAYTSGPTAPNTMSIVGGGGISSSASNSEFISTSFLTGATSGDKAMRCVAFAIRIRYIGTTLNAAGTCYTLQLNPRSPSNTPQGYGVPQIKACPGFKEYTFRDSRWHTITRHIQMTEDMQYQQFSTPNSYWQYMMLGSSATAPASGDHNAVMTAFIATGQPGAPFEWEVVGHYEIIGSNLNRKAISNSQVHHVEKVTNAFGELRHRNSTVKDHTVDSNSRTSWINILKTGAEALLPLVPSVIEMLL